MRKYVSLAMAAGLALAFAAHAAAAEKLKIGFLPGVVDPFYQVMQLGVEKAAKDLGVDVVTQIPPTWGVEAQTPLLDAMVARGDLNYIITAPVDKDQMVGPLQAAVDHGIKVITVDTFLGDGDYVKGPVKFPISYIGSDNVEGGRIAARGLAKAIGGKGTVYINSTNPNVSSVEGRAKASRRRWRKISRTSRWRVRTSTWTTPIRRRNRRRRCWRANPTSPASSAPTCSARRARAPRSSTRASAAMSRLSPMTRRRRQSSSWARASSSLVLAQKPFDMGYLAVMFAQADAAGVTSLPRRVETGFAIIDKSNVKDPAIARFIYQVPGK